MNRPATPAKPRATSPRGSRTIETIRAVPPAPVSGAPRGITTGVVVAGEVVGAAVVLVVAPGVVDVVVEVDEVVVDVEEDVVVEPDARHVGTVIVLPSMVTAPPIARARPLTVAPVSSVIEVVAIIVPAKFVVVPRVAELVTCQNILHD